MTQSECSDIKFNVISYIKQSFENVLVLNLVSWCLVEVEKRKNPEKSPHRSNGVNYRLTDNYRQHIGRKIRLNGDPEEKMHAEAPSKFSPSPLAKSN